MWLWAACSHLLRFVSHPISRTPVFVILMCLRVDAACPTSEIIDLSTSYVRWRCGCEKGDVEGLKIFHTNWGAIGTAYSHVDHVSLARAFIAAKPRHRFSTSVLSGLCRYQELFIPAFVLKTVHMYTFYVMLRSIHRFLLPLHDIQWPSTFRKLKRQVNRFQIWSLQYRSATLTEDKLYLPKAKKWVSGETRFSLQFWRVDTVQKRRLLY